MDTHSLPPASTSARDNPFRDECLARLEFRLPGQHTWDSLLARLANVNWCGAIVGPHGSGKTTLIEQLAPRVEQRGFRPRLFRLDAASKMSDKEALLAAVRALRAPDLLLIDGAEQLSTRQWLPLRVAAETLSGLVVTVHRSSRLPTLIETETSAALLNELVAELAEFQLPPLEATAIFTRHRGNIRDCLRELHDRWPPGELI